MQIDKKQARIHQLERMVEQLKQQLEKKDQQISKIHSQYNKKIPNNIQNYFHQLFTLLSSCPPYIIQKINAYMSFLKKLRQEQFQNGYDSSYCINLQLFDGQRNFIHFNVNQVQFKFIRDQLKNIVRTDKNAQQIQQIKIMQQMVSFAKYFVEQQIYPYFYRWSIQQYRTIQYCQRKTPILQIISHIQFQQLNTLVLKNCIIKTIEPLTWMCVPKLTQLHIQSQFIISFQSLSKTRFKSLKTLSINDKIPHNLTETKQLQRMNTSKTLWCLRIANNQLTYLKNGNPKQISNLIISLLVKIQPTQINKLYISNKMYNKQDDFIFSQNKKFIRKNVYRFKNIQQFEIYKYSQQ